MLFTTYTYFVFLALAVAGHWALPSGRARSIWLIACSLAFYTVTQGGFALLLSAYVVFNWWAGQRLARPGRDSRFLWIAVAANLAPLLYYKYAPALAASVGSSAALARWIPSETPLGISFFAFQASAYVIDVAAGGVVIASLIDFAVFKTLWAQLVAGPIVRASELWDQLRVRHWDSAAAVSACGRILNGLAKKIVLADALAPIADQAFRAASPAFLDVVFGTLAFGLQIYFDFSAYSDIAIGSARLLGFRLPENFDWPYAALSPQEFWQRWHMTLSRWIRDYVFVPLSIQYRRSPLMARASIIIAMVLCGAWHGAGLTFMLWGFWHGLLLVMTATVLRPFYAAAAAGRPLHRLLAFATTLALVQVGWIFFRAESLQQVGQFLTVLGTFRGGLQRAAVRENGILIVGLLWAGVLAMQYFRHRVGDVRRSALFRASLPLLRAC
ncbi:MAG: MBOAT family O-acyltransferase, partial [Gemmatimonadota bacterium]